MKTLACLLLTMLGCEVMAQVTTASLRGAVTNSSNETLAGAAVILSHPVTGTSYGVTADGEGRFAIHGIKPDDGYVLEASYVGCDDFTKTDFRLRVGETRTENIVLNENNRLAEVVVETRNAGDGGMTNVYDEKTISQMPTVSRSLYDIVRLMPQAVATKNGGISYGGVNNRYNAFMINGMANNDMYGLSSSGTNGGLSNANPISLDALSQIEAAAVSYDVRTSGFAGGVINAVTKSGTNEFRGSAYTYYNNRNFYGTTAGRDVARREKLDDQSTRIHGVTLGGPIVKNKLFLFLSGEYNTETSPSSYYLGYEGTALSQSELDRIAARYREVTGFDGGGYGRRDVKQRSGSLLARLDWNIDSRNHLSLSYSYLDARAEEYGNSLASFTFVGSGYANYSTAHYLAAMLESRISDRLHNSLRIGYSRVGDGRTPDVADMPSVIIRNTGTTGGVTTYIGTDRYAGTNALTQNVVTLTDDLIMDRGAHSITVGMHHELYNIHNIYLANHYGTYTYNSVADFENDMAAVYEYNYTDPEVAGTTTWGPRFRAAELNLYVQDRWAVGRSLQLTYGVRATAPLIFNTPTPNEKFNSGDIAAKYGVRIGDVPESRLMLSPRIGLTWRRDFERGRLTVEGGAGIFAGHVPFVWIVNNYSNTGVEQKGVRLTAPMQNGEVIETAAPFTPTPSPTTLSNTAFTLNAMNRKFRYPQNFKANAMAGYETDDGWSARIEALYTKTIRNAVFANLAVERTGDEVYAVPQSGDKAAAGAMPSFRSTASGYSAVYYLDDTSRGYSYSLSGSLSKTFPFGLAVSASYIFGHSYSVCDVPSTSSSTNWTRTYAPDLNDRPLALSIYDVPHKLTVAAAYNKRYAKLFEVSASVVYQMTSGQRYSVCFGESVDFNGDGAYGSTLMYIPTEEEMDRMRFADDASRGKWNDYIESSRYLRSRRGSFAERNAMQAPTEHTVDLHLAHGFYFGAKSRRKIEISLDIMNFGNMLCRHWGAYYNVGGWRMQPVNIVAVEDGAPVYRFTSAELTPDDLFSRWHMQLGARIVF